MSGHSFHGSGSWKDWEKQKRLQLMMTLQQRATKKHTCGHKTQKFNPLRRYYLTEDPTRDHHLQNPLDGPTHHAAGKADTAQSRADVVPHTDAAPADTLAHGQLQEEERDANQDQQDEVGHQVRTCRKGRKTNRIKNQTEKRSEQHSEKVASDAFILAGNLACFESPGSGTHHVVCATTTEFKLRSKSAGPDAHTNKKFSTFLFFCF